MYIRRLELRQLRRHSELCLDLSEQTTVVVGPNGAGKTTVLESIDLLVSGGSFRAAAAEQLIAHHQTQARVTGIAVVPPARELSLAVDLRTTGRSKLHLLNDKPVRRHSDLHRVVARTSFTSADLDLVRGSPSFRRSFLDEAVGHLTPRGEQTVASYERTVRQRNALLKQLKSRPSTEGWATLDVWDERVAELGAELTRMRLEILARARVALAEAYNEISGSTGFELVADYQHNSDPAAFASHIAEARQLDVLTGVTHIGPHRDDVLLRLGDRNLRQLGSSGEQRSAVLAWKITTHRAVQEQWGVTPVLLLDDVFSELDERRCRAVLRLFGDGQVIISAVGIPPNTNVDHVVHLPAPVDEPMDAGAGPITFETVLGDEGGLGDD